MFLIDFLGLQPPISPPNKRIERIDHNSPPEVFTSRPLAIEMSPNSNPQQQQQQQQIQSPPPRDEPVEPNPVVEEINPTEGEHYPDSPGFINLNEEQINQIGWLSN